MPCIRLLDICKLLTFLGHLFWGPVVGRACRRRRRRSLVDGHDVLTVPPLSQDQLKLDSMLLYLYPGAFFGWISWFKWWEMGGEWVGLWCWKGVALVSFIYISFH